MIIQNKKNPFSPITFEHAFKHADIIEISVYAFMKMAERSENEVIAMWPRDFEQLNHSVSSGANVIIDVVSIIANDYEKFFNKMRKKLFNMKQLKERVFNVYHK